LADAVEGTVRALPEAIPTRIEAAVHNMAMKRLQDGQFDECDLSLRELSLIEASMVKTLAAHYHGRVAYPKSSLVLKQPLSQGNRFTKELQNGKPLNNHKTESPEEIREEIHSEPDEQTPEQTEQETN
jgi:hypothetical protein